MKFEWIKYNLVPTLMGVVFLGALGYGGWGWWKTYRATAVLTSELQVQEERFSALTEGRKEFPPTAPNLAQLRENRAKLEEIYGNLKAVAAQSVKVPPLTPVQFASRRAQVLRVMLNAARQEEVLLPDNRFTFGFTDVGVLPPVPDVPRLTKQLIVTEALCSKLFSSGILKLDSIECLSGTTVTNILHRRTPYTLKFTCDTPTLQKFLNSLQTMDWLFSIRSVTVQATPVAPVAHVGAGLPLMAGPAGFRPGAMPPGVPPPGVPPGRGGPRAPLPEAGINPNPLEPVVQEPPRNVLSVTLHLDLIELEGDAPTPRKTT